MKQMSTKVVGRRSSSQFSTFGQRTSMYSIVDEDEHVKALKIQNAFRRYRSKKEQAALLIQKNYRAHLCLKVFCFCFFLKKKKILIFKSLFFQKAKF